MLTQESAAIQILLECCQEEVGEGDGGRLRAVQETRSQICCYLHQAFIKDTNLAKLVLFQGYPHSLLPVTIHVHLSCHSTRVTLTAQSGQAGVRSGSHLPSVRGVRHAQLSLSTARLAVNAVWTLLGVLPASERDWYVFLNL